MFHIRREQQVDLHLRAADFEDPTLTLQLTLPTRDAVEDQVTGRLGDDKAVITYQSYGAEVLVPVRSVAYVEVRPHANTNAAQAELRQHTTTGMLFLCDPEQHQAWPIALPDTNDPPDNPEVRTFSYDVASMVNGDLDIEDIAAGSPRHVDNEAMVLVANWHATLGTTIHDAQRAAALRGYLPDCEHPGEAY